MPTSRPSDRPPHQPGPGSGLWVGGWPTEPIREATGAPVVMLHGFTQNSECWGRFGAILAANHRLRLVDAPGHGRSGHDDIDLWSGADLIVDRAGPGTYLGYSMGGRLALHVALRAPQLVRGLVLLGASPGISVVAEREERRRRDADLADELEREGLDRFLDRWLAQPLFAGLPESAAAREQRRANRPEGLAASLRQRGTGVQESLWSRLRELEMPVLYVAGERDEKYRALGSAFVEAVGPNAELAIVMGGHAAHLEVPDLVADTVIDFLASSVAR